MPTQNVIGVCTYTIETVVERMLYLANYNIKEGKEKEYQKFLRDNKKAFPKFAPKGWKYRGTYFYVLGFGPYHAVDFWECTNYADFDTWRNYNDPNWIRLARQAMEFTTEEPTTAWLLRGAGDTKIIEPKEKP